MRVSTKKLVLAAFFLALGFILPEVTMQIPGIGSRLLPMHLPVLICGYICGGGWGFLIGLIVPILRSALRSMPPMYPTAIAMAFELATYGLLTGLLNKWLPKKAYSIYVSLIGAMIGGRIIYGIASYVLLGLQGNSYTMKMFMAGAFFNAIPGIILQILLVPALVLALRKAKLQID